MDSKLILDTKSVESYLKLLLAFGRLPETKRSRTFMDVSGYPHYENVCSNILKFFFDPAAEHGLGDLLVVAFLKMAGVQEVPSTDNLRVFTRQGTYGGNTIDIVIDCEAFTIGIENKVFHELLNDLKDYGKYIDILGKGKPLVIKAVLGLRHVRKIDLLTGGFVSYTYGQLWQQVHELLGHRIGNADPKWVAYLLDLIETTNNLAGQNMELQKTDQFFIEHNEVIEKMIAGRNAFLNRLSQMVSTLCTMMGESKAAAALSRAPWIYADSCLVLDFQFANAYAIAFDLVLKPTGWELQIFGRNKKSEGYLNKLIGEPSLREQCKSAAFVGSRHILQTWLLQADLAEIRDALCSWVDALIAASKSASK